MESTLSRSRTASAIWSRIVKPELARAILRLDFDTEDHRRVDELSAKARKGTLTPEERAELDEYIRVGNELAVLQSKARLSLKWVSTNKETGGEEPSAGRASARRAATAGKAAANGPAASAGAKPATTTCSGSWALSSVSGPSCSRPRSQSVRLRNAGQRVRNGTFGIGVIPVLAV
jgi:hypothetical protein